MLETISTRIDRFSLELLETMREKRFNELRNLVLIFIFNIKESNFLLNLITKQHFASLSMIFRRTQQKQTKTPTSKYYFHMKTKKFTIIR
jgi:hypothetical protein